MKKLLVLFASFTSFAAFSQSVGINADGSNPNGSAMLDVKSTTKGFLLPRMSNAQMLAIQNPAQGLLAFCADCGTNGDYYFYKGSAWVALGSTTVTVSTTIGPMGANATANGATITNGILNLAPANASYPGIVTIGDQTIAGVKTFSNGIVGNVTGNVNGNAATVTTNANLTGVVTSTGNATSIANGGISNAMLANGAVTNLSGTNTGDQTLPTLSSLGAVASNTAITGATNTKITYDAKGLVTAGTVATTSDIAASANKNYVTDAQQIIITNTSGTNTGDNAVNNRYNGLVSNANHDGDVSGSTTLTIVNNAVTTAKIAVGAITDSKVTDVAASKITGILPVTKGGTGSDTQNFVDLTTAQTIAGIKTFSNGIVANVTGNLTGNASTATTANNVSGTVAIANGGTGTNNGSISGTSALTFAAGGTNQNVVITPSGTGNTILGGQTGIGTSSPTTSAKLEINATNKGFLLPRVTLTGSTDATTIATPATSLLVYNTATTSDVVPGYYYNSETSGSPVWIRLNTSSVVTGANSGETINWNSSTSQWQITGTSALALGNGAGQTTQGINALALGNGAGQTSQGTGAIGLGYLAGQILQGNRAIGLGYLAGNSGQGINALALGNGAGQTTQGINALALGNGAGQTLQGTGAIGLGYLAGQTTQGYGAIGLGWQAGQTNQGGQAIGLGSLAGQTNQGQYSVAIGYAAGRNNQAANSIILNASGFDLNSDFSSATYISPIRNVTTSNLLYYNTTTKEVTYSAKTFVINHPTKPDSYLVHACLEGPEAGVYYRGESKIENNQSVVVKLPDYVSSFATNFSINITPIYSDDSDENIVYRTSRVKDNAFTVHGKNGSFYWIVYGQRGKVDVEPKKSEVQVSGDGPYKYIKSGK